MANFVTVQYHDFNRKPKKIDINRDAICTLHPVRKCNHSYLLDTQYVVDVEFNTWTLNSSFKTEQEAQAFHDLLRLGEVKEETKNPIQWPQP